MALEWPRPLVAGNWKMNGLRSARDVLREIQAGYTPGLKGKVELLVCPPATLMYAFAREAVGSRIAIGGQDCHAKESGAFTGDLSAEMLADAGATYVIVGHSERRQYHAEKDPDVCAKAAAAHRAGLTAIVCVGETRAEREAGRTLAVVREQLRGSVPEQSDGHNLVVAYEPVWAIGTGRVATPEQAQEAHAFIRKMLAEISDQSAADKIRIQYGGSVKPDNAGTLMSQPDIDGALVGGASLDPRGFAQIVRAAVTE